MIALDTNVLVYAHRTDSEWHQKARTAVMEVAEGPSAWAIPWSCLHEFLAIVTHPRIYRPASTIEQAFEQVRAWLESPSLVLLTESDAHLPTLERLLTESRSTGPRVHDARVAALCVEHGVSELWTLDRDFARFAGVPTKNPFVER